MADWPCFSKFYITFPLDKIPPGKVILSAALTLNFFGNAGGGQWGPPPKSLIQVFTVGQDWDKSTINWNNAPQAIENVSRAWVYPISSWPPDVPYHWDLSYAVNQAYQAGIPLRLALYSADYPRHTGKYFWSSQVGDWDANSRPTLDITVGAP